MKKHTHITGIYSASCAKERPSGHIQISDHGHIGEGKLKAEGGERRFMVGCGGPEGEGSMKEKKTNKLIKFDFRSGKKAENVPTLTMTGESAVLPTTTTTQLQTNFSAG